MRYQLTPIHCRPWLVAYLSIKLIESHYENDYGAALRRLNAITETLRSLDFATEPGYVINGLKREELIALNATLLHELYFASLGGNGGKPTGLMADAIARDFGSVERWQDEFIAMGNALGGGSGWVLLVYIPRDRRLVNQYASEDSQAVAGGIPIVALDMHEHAYHMDFGANPKAYVGMFMRNLDWKAIQARYEDAAKVEPPQVLFQPELGDLPGVGVEEVKALLDAGKYNNEYGEALRRLNAITEKLRSLDFATAPGYVINSLKREELIALNSTLLDELYFASLGGNGGKPTGPMADALTRDFGSVDRWQDEFIAMGNALGGGSGWVLLVYVPRDRRLINQYASDDSQAVAGGIPIVALGMCEHAYQTDFGANAKAYVGMFMHNLDWKAIQARYEDAAKVEPLRALVQPEFGDLPGVGVEEVKAMLDAGKPVQVIDARPWPAVSRGPEIMQGAIWRDPERVQEWAGELSKTEPVITFCSYGFHVGCKTAIALRDLGFDAKFMTGGHSAWKAIDGPTKPYV